VTNRTYRLIVEGELSEGLEHAFGGMRLTRAEGSTALTGNVRDQAELQGLLQRVSDLGLTLLEARAIDERPERRPGDGTANADAAGNRLPTSAKAPQTRI
jgi:hypothetical protein